MIDMLYNKVFRNKVETKFGDFIKYQIFVKSSDKKEKFQIYLTINEFIKLRAGTPLNSKELNLPEDTIDFLRKYNIPRDLDGSIRQTGYITNATANSLVYYAFLNSNYFSPNQIIKLREKYSLNNFENRTFTKEELLENLNTQSAFFLNIYAFMNENDRFENFIDNIESENNFKNFYSHYKSADELKKNYNRRIFHTELDCDAMTNDYIKVDNFQKNTGVFSKNILTKNIGYYSLSSKYLKKIGMQHCESCKF